MKSRAESWLARAQGGQGGPTGRAALGLVSALHGGGAALASLGYDLGWRRPARLPAPVVGVGNLSMGGVGKTPLVMEVVRVLTGWGLPAGVISRGYGGRASGAVTWVSQGAGLISGAHAAGDEAVLLASRLAVPVAVGKNRLAVGREMLRTCGPRVLVGDDLFQHRRLHRDLDLVALDASRPPDDQDRLPPALYREFASALRRAQAMVLTHAQDPEITARWRRWLRDCWGPGPVLACRHRVRSLEDREGRVLEPGPEAGARVLAFCGLGRPGSFQASLENLGLEVVDLVSFGDHHPFEEHELARLSRLGRELGVSALVCSQKDQVRLPASLPADPPWWVTRLELEFDPGPPSLDQVLAWGLSAWEPGS